MRRISLAEVMSRASGGWPGWGGSPLPDRHRARRRSVHDGRPRAGRRRLPRVSQRRHHAQGERRRLRPPPRAGMHGVERRLPHRRHRHRRHHGRDSRRAGNGSAATSSTSPPGRPEPSSPPAPRTCTTSARSATAPGSPLPPAATPSAGPRSPDAEGTWGPHHSSALTIGHRPEAASTATVGGLGGPGGRRRAGWPGRQDRGDPRLAGRRGRSSAVPGCHGGPGSRLRRSRRGRRRRRTASIQPRSAAWPASARFRSHAPASATSVTASGGAPCSSWGWLGGLPGVDPGGGRS